MSKVFGCHWRLTTANGWKRKDEAMDAFEIAMRGSSMELGKPSGGTRKERIESATIKPDPTEDYNEHKITWMCPHMSLYFRK